ncbi:hypothetical protein D3C75_791790 [compost metagenome]
MGPFLHQPAAGGAADASGAAGDQHYLTGEFRLRRGQGQLIQLKRPVLHIVGLVFTKGYELAQGGGAPHNGNGPVVQRAADLGHGVALAGIDHAHTGNEDNPGCRLEHLVAFILVALEVSLVLFLVLADARLEGFLQGSHITGGRVPIHQKGLHLGMHQMVRTSRANLGQLSRVPAAGKPQHIRGWLASRKRQSPAGVPAQAVLSSHRRTRPLPSPGPQ